MICDSGVLAVRSFPTSLRWWQALVRLKPAGGSAHLSASTNTHLHLFLAGGHLLLAKPAGNAQMQSGNKLPALQIWLLLRYGPAFAAGCHSLGLPTTRMRSAVPSFS